MASWEVNTRLMMCIDDYDLGDDVDANDDDYGAPFH